MNRFGILVILILTVAAFSARTANGSDRMERFVFKPTDTIRRKPGHARSLLSETEYRNSPWIREIEKVLEYSVQEFDRHPKQGLSNVSFSCLLDKNGKLTEFLPVDNINGVDAAVKDRGIAFLQNSLKNCHFSAPTNAKVKIVIHFYQYSNFGIEQESL
ncbi:MAG: hypothetical protein BWY75_00685 [bacterium ADurb.Bin425]|nr:MAG: hypothetical protein BWY75_00685 [bacterium ADurb.Bin425]